MSGYALAFRERWEHRLFKNKQEAAVWAWMCDTARWGTHSFQTRFGPVTLERGQLLVSERGIADDFGLHKNTVRRLIQLMSDDGMITLNRDHKASRAGTIITITNYERYQSHDGASAEARDQGGTAKRTKTGPRRDQDGTTREYSKYNEYKEGSPSDSSAGEPADALPLPSSRAPAVDAVGPAFAAYDAMRREIVPGARAIELTSARRQKLAARLADIGGAQPWAEALAQIRGSPFLCGENRTGKFIAEIDWLLKPENLRKVREGNYDGRPNARAANRANAAASPLDALRFAYAATGTDG